MSLEEDLSRLEGLQEAANQSQQEADEFALGMIPEVLAHFNQFVDKEVRPKISEHYTLGDATKAVYNRGLFKITLGEIDTGKKLLGYHDRGYLGDEAHRAISNYVRQTPWVFDVKLSFNVPK